MFPEFMNKNEGWILEGMGTRSSKLVPVLTLVLVPFFVYYSVTVKNDKNQSGSFQKENEKTPGLISNLWFVENLDYVFKL